MGKLGMGAAAREQMAVEKADNTSALSGKSGRAADELFEVFIEKIYAGELTEGDPLPTEREIVENYGVSRTVVREAVQALANKGLVEARPRFRPIVRKPNYDAALETLESVVGRLLVGLDGVQNLFETRILVEAMLVRQAAQEARKEDLAAMKAALEANKAAIQDSEAFYKTDMAFHRVLYQIPRNPLLPSIHKAYMTWLSPYWSKMPRLPERNRVNYESHLAIYEAILMRDPDEAETALRNHMSDAWSQVCRTFQED